MTDTGMTKIEPSHVWTLRVRSSLLLSVLGTVRIKFFEKYQTKYCGRQQKQHTSDLIKKSHGISDLFVGCKHLTKLPIKDH